MTIPVNIPVNVVLPRNELNFSNMMTEDFLETSTDTLKRMLSVYGRTRESFVEDVTAVKEWMKTQPHLPEILDDKSIQNFLLLNKCSVEKTKRKIDAYYTIRSQIPEIFESINPKSPNMIELMDIIYWIPLPKLAEDKYRVVVCKIRNKDLIDTLDPHNVFRHIINVLELRLKEDTMCGDVVICDMDGVSLAYLSKLTPSLLAKIFAIYEKVFSSPLKASYIINSPPFFNTVLAIMKIVMKPKLFQRIHVCQDNSILKEHLAKELLPQDFGGEQQSLEEIHKRLKLNLERSQARFDQLDKLRVIENLRPKKLENDEILGFYGNFKKLDVD